ncbi:AmiS/UreI family transporter [Psychrobacter sp. S1-30-MNA-CIBAN-0213]|uniref:AmiS/UreI family transporter n=1 Tax=Psychrobacter sp. S1-30-MNA-CIBAN-0213 TaxID=3140456 RepID=UPI003323D574
MLGLTLLYVGAVLFVNGLWLLGKIEDKEVAVINLLVGFLSFLIAIYLVFNKSQDLNLISAGAFTFLFAFTYIWVGANQFLKSNSKGLGWFCFFVSLTALTIALNSTFKISMDISIWSIFNWYAWSVLWFLFFVMLSLSKNIQRQVGLFTIFCAVTTGWIPGLLILQNIYEIY